MREENSVGGGGLFESMWRDVRYGVRVLRRSPGFTLAAVVTLALGIGANTAIFSVIYGVLLRPLPYREGERLVVVRQQARLNNVNSLGFSVKEFFDYRDQSQTMESMVEHHSMNFILYGRDEPERVQTGVVSSNFFDVLGVKPLLGRSFTPEDETAGRRGRAHAQPQVLAAQPRRRPAHRRPRLPHEQPPAHRRRRAPAHPRVPVRERRVHADRQLPVPLKPADHRQPSGASALRRLRPAQARRDPGAGAGGHRQGRRQPASDLPGKLPEEHRLRRAGAGAWARR